MKWPEVSAGVIVAMPIVILVYDFVAYYNAGSKGTISQVALSTSESRPWFLMGVCFLFGLLCGHLFAPRESEPHWTEYIHAVVVVLVPLLSVLFDVVAVSSGNRGSAMQWLGDEIREHRMLAVIVALVSGALIGHRLVCQHLPPIG